MKNILIFGSNGFLTTNLRYRFNNNHNIKYAGSKNFDFKFNYQQEDLEKILNQNHFDLILNCIGCADIDECEKNKNLAYRLNCEFPSYLIKSLNKYKRKTKIIHISTDHFYDSDNFSTEKEIKIINYYSETKLLGEKILMDYDSLILRTNFIGKSLHPTKTSLTDWFFYNLQNNIPFNAFSDIYFTPLSFHSLAIIIQLIFDNFQYGIFNLGSVGSISKFDLANNLAIIMKKENLINKISSDNLFQTKRAKNMSMNCDLFSNVFKYKLPSIDDEISNVYNEYLSKSIF